MSLSLLALFLLGVVYLLPSSCANNNDSIGSHYRRLLRGSENIHQDNEERTAAEQRRRRQIVGGSDVASANEYPYFVEMDLGCGGSFIYENVVLTAGHCITRARRWEPNVYIGSHERGDGILRRISGVAIHAKFGDDADFGNDNDSLFGYDLALLTLNEPVVGVTPVELNRDNTYPSDETTNADNVVLTIIGQGKTRANGKKSQILQKVDKPYMNHDQCSQTWGEKGVIIDAESMICAGGIQNEDSCDGDSGGPLLDARSGVQVGLVSFGSEFCGAEGVPAVYSRTSTAMDWIDDFICINAPLSSSKPSSCEAYLPVKVEITNSQNFCADEPIGRWHLKVREDHGKKRSILFVPSETLNDEQQEYKRIVNLSPGRYSLELGNANSYFCGRSTNYKISMVDNSGEDTTTAGSPPLECSGVFCEAMNFAVTQKGELFLDDDSSVIIIAQGDDEDDNNVVVDDSTTTTTTVTDNEEEEDKTSPVAITAVDGESSPVTVVQDVQEQLQQGGEEEVSTATTTTTTTTTATTTTSPPSVVFSAEEQNNVDDSTNIIEAEQDKTSPVVISCPDESPPETIVEDVQVQLQQEREQVSAAVTATTNTSPPSVDSPEEDSVVDVSPPLIVTNDEQDKSAPAAAVVVTAVDGESSPAAQDLQQQLQQRPSDAASSTDLRIDITYDDSPDKTSWALIHRDDKDVIYRSQSGTVTNSGLVSVTVNNVPDGNYWLFVLDSEGNGISSSNNLEDAIRISRVWNDGRDASLLASHPGTFESLCDLEFTLQ